MTVPLSSLDGQGSRREQLGRALRGAILGGDMPEGSRLPPTRDLARQLGCARNVVLEVYSDLRDDGLVVAQRGGGTRVASGASLRTRSQASLARRATKAAAPARPELLAAGAQRLAWAPGPKVPFDFSLGPPLPDEAFLRVVRTVSRDVIERATVRDLDYPDVAGLASLRGALAARLSLHRGLACDASELVITTGASQAFDLIVRALVQPGDHVAVEDPGYRPVRAATIAAGASVVPIRVDEQGLDVDALRALRTPPRLVFLTPTHQFPTGVTLSMDRRGALLEYATRTGTVLVEDDYDGELPERGRLLPTLAGLAPEAPVLYVGSLSKTLGPFLRLGYLRAPGAMAATFTMEKALADGGAAALPQHIATALLAHPGLGRWTRRATDLSVKRRHVLEAAVVRSRGAMRVRSVAPHHLVVELPDVPPSHEGRLVKAALERGVRVLGLRSFSARPSATACLLLGCGRLPEAAIPGGVSRLATLSRQLR